ncbi:MAG TPA: hypothetical protein VK590_07355 [Saprospiraceae bacterium]|nr:hypothetical protein [Saprospiraceae bacterium]
MDKKVISVSHKMKGLLDDEYTLYDDGSVLHKYDKNTYQGGQNFEENLTIDELSEGIKLRLYESASGDYKKLVQKTLKI